MSYPYFETYHENQGYMTTYPEHNSYHQEFYPDSSSYYQDSYDSFNIQPFSPPSFSPLSTPPSYENLNYPPAYHNDYQYNYSNQNNFYEQINPYQNQQQNFYENSYENTFPNNYYNISPYDSYNSSFENCGNTNSYASNDSTSNAIAMMLEENERSMASINNYCSIILKRIQEEDEYIKKNNFDNLVLSEDQSFPNTCEPLISNYSSHLNSSIISPMDQKQNLEVENHYSNPLFNNMDEVNIEEYDFKTTNFENTSNISNNYNNISGQQILDFRILESDQFLEEPISYSNNIPKENFTFQEDYSSFNNIEFNNIEMEDNFIKDKEIINESVFQNSKDLTIPIIDNTINNNHDIELSTNDVINIQDNIIIIQQKLEFVNHELINKEAMEENIISDKDFILPLADCSEEKNIDENNIDNTPKDRIIPDNNEEGIFPTTFLKLFYKKNTFEISDNYIDFIGVTRTSLIPPLFLNNLIMNSRRLYYNSLNIIFILISETFDLIKKRLRKLLNREYG